MFSIEQNNVHTTPQHGTASCMQSPSCAAVHRHAARKDTNKYTSVDKQHQAVAGAATMRWLPSACIGCGLTADRMVIMPVATTTDS